MKIQTFGVYPSPSQASTIAACEYASRKCATLRAHAAHARALDLGAVTYFCCVDETCTFSFFTPPLLLNARRDYAAKRINGEGGGDVPGDGKYTWIKGNVSGGDVYGVKESDGYYHYEVRYDEGPKDKEWMEEGDWKYIQGLMRDGKLLEKEPNADKEIAPDHKYQVEITQALNGSCRRTPKNA